MRDPLVFVWLIRPLQGICWLYTCHGQSCRLLSHVSLAEIRSLVHLAAQIAKSLTLGQHDEDFNLQLGEALMVGNLCARLSEACFTRGAAKAYCVMRDDLQSLAERSMAPTLNICRQWVVEVAQHALSSGNIDMYVESLRLWKNDIEADDDGSVVFDRETPIFALVAPTHDEEDLAKDNKDSEYKGETLAEQIQADKDFQQ
jgi:hypothetical protein